MGGYRSPYIAASQSALQSGAGRTFHSGVYYTGMPNSGDGATAITYQAEHAVRFEVGVAARFVEIGLDITTFQASGLVRLGVRYDDGSGMPGALLVDAGTIDASTNGYKAAASFDQTLTPGRWWLCAVTQGASGIAVRTRGTDPFIGAATTASANTACYTQSGVTGGLPASFTLPAATSSNAPKILVKAA